MTINLNSLAKEISQAEGQKQELSIAQIKEVLRITLEILAAEHPADVLNLVRKYE